MFHEKYEFFILWGMFPIIMLISGLFHIQNNDFSLYSFIPILFLSMFDKFVHKYFFWNHNFYILYSTLLLFITYFYIDFYITYIKILEFSVWFYAVQYCSLEDSKTHFPFYGMVMIYSYPLLTFVNNNYEINKSISSISIISLHILISLLLYFNNPKVQYNYNKLNKKNYYLPILFFIYHWLHKDSSNQLYISINHSFVTNIGKIQYGVIGVSVFISAVIAHLYKNINWVYIMIAYSIIDIIVINLLVPELNIHISNEIQVIYFNIVHYLLVIPSLLMMITQQAPYNTFIFFCSYMSVYSLANILPFYYHPSIQIILCIIWCIVCKLLSDFNTQEILIRENSCDDCQFIQIS